MSISPDPIQPENDNHAANPTEEAQLPHASEEQPRTEEEVAGTPSSSSVDELPPEAQGETNGGPLGCCLGVTIGLLLSLSVALISRFYADPLAHILGGALSLVIRIIMAFVAIIAIVVCGNVGWSIGKKLYREYQEPPAL